jgi:hypothetical protein
MCFQVFSNHQLSCLSTRPPRFQVDTQSEELVHFHAIVVNAQQKALSNTTEYRPPSPLVPPLPSLPPFPYKAAYLDEHGYVVVANAVPEEAVDGCLSLLWDFLEGTPFKKLG